MGNSFLDGRMDAAKPQSPDRHPNAVLNFACFVAPSVGMGIVMAMGKAPVEKHLPRLVIDAVCLGIEWGWLLGLLWAIYQVSDGQPSPRKKQVAILSLLGLIPVLLMVVAGIG